MAVSRFSYVRSYESSTAVLPNTYMIVRLDGKGFHAFSTLHAFAKPNDVRALLLANRAAEEVVRRMKPDVTLAYGESDEYSCVRLLHLPYSLLTLPTSFLLRRRCTLYSRRASKLLSHITSLFTAAYVSFWPAYFDTHCPLRDLPIFDGRLVVYPTEQEVRDYFAWRGADSELWLRWHARGGEGARILQVKQLGGGEGGGMSVGHAGKNNESDSFSSSLVRSWFGSVSIEPYSHRRCVSLQLFPPPLSRRRSFPLSKNSAHQQSLQHDLLGLNPPRWPLRARGARRAQGHAGGGQA
jgi:hypothetical protein